MIPPLNEDGYLPPGIYRATLDEVIAHFGHGSDAREAGADSLRWLVPICQKAGIARLVVNGSFVTEVLEPNDVDCILLQGLGYNEASEAAIELERGLPYLSLQIVRQGAFDYLANSFFAIDRMGVAKGVIEVLL